MTLFRLFILNFYNVYLKLPSKDWQAIETDQSYFQIDHENYHCHLVLLWFLNVKMLSQKTVKGCVSTGIKLLIKFANKFLAY